VKKIQEPSESSGDVNAHSSNSILSVDTTSVLSLFDAAITLLNIKIKAKFDKPNKLMQIFFFLSICIPLSTFIIRLVGRFPFWAFWLLSYYGTIWAFGHYNKSKCDIQEDFTKGINFYVTRKMFLPWFFIESILFLTIGWYHVPIRGPVAFFVVYFLLFAAGGLIYGLGDVTCPHCRAINAGRRSKATDEQNEYRCCICKKIFSHYKGL